jgi:beta-lactamase superfamily II metal-dependent hydrolase
MWSKLINFRKQNALRALRLRSYFSSSCPCVMRFKTTLSKLVSLHSSLLYSRNLLHCSARTMASAQLSSTVISTQSNAFAKVHLVPMFDDNYGFLLVDRATNTLACVDPGDGQAIRVALDELNLDLNFILVTHKHADHVGGVLDLKRTYPNAVVVGTKYETLPTVDTPVGEGDAFTVGSLPVQVLSNFKLQQTYYNDATPAFAT